MDAQEYAYFVGVDWGCEQHQVCVLNPNGEVVAEWRVAHGGAAVREWCDRLGGLAPPARLAVAQTTMAEVRQAMKLPTL